MWCECGYDFETGDRRSVVAKAREARREARGLKLRGFAVLAFAPLLVMVGAPVLGVAPVLWAIVAAQLALGGTWTLLGFRRGRLAGRRLALSSAPMPLPAARIIE